MCVPIFKQYFKDQYDCSAKPGPSSRSSILGATTATAPTFGPSSILRWTGTILFEHASGGTGGGTDDQA